METRLQPNQSVNILINAKELFGGNIHVTVKKGEEYSFKVAKGEKWKDSWICTDADGFLNPLLLFSGKRFDGARCFTLCGTINKDEDHHFKIGSSLSKYKIPVSGILYFFPNDSIHHYENNSGTLQVQVTRVF